MDGEGREGGGREGGKEGGRTCVDFGHRVCEERVENSVVRVDLGQGLVICERWDQWESAPRRGCSHRSF